MGRQGCACQTSSSLGCRTNRQNFVPSILLSFSAARGLSHLPRWFCGSGVRQASSAARKQLTGLPDRSGKKKEKEKIKIIFKKRERKYVAYGIWVTEIFSLLSRLINGQQGITIKNYSTRSLLTVTNVTEEHFGNYTCVAANKLGTTNASLPLNRK